MVPHLVYMTTFKKVGDEGTSGDQAKSVIFWTSRDCPLKKVLGNPRDFKVDAVKRYVENGEVHRRYQLMDYFNLELAKTLPCVPPNIVIKVHHCPPY